MNRSERAEPQFQVITLVGNLTTDPVIKRLDADRKVCNLRIAVNGLLDGFSGFDVRDV